MQALPTRKVKARGDLGLLMRKVPTMRDFVRCVKEITYGTL